VRRLAAPPMTEGAAVSGFWGEQHQAGNEALRRQPRPVEKSFVSLAHLHN
jgi:hypothetical protein